MSEPLCGCRWKRDARGHGAGEACGATATVMVEMGGARLYVCHYHEKQIEKDVRFPIVGVTITALNAPEVSVELGGANVKAD